jgi:hypothetical protein
MVLTVLEAEIDPGRERELMASYREAAGETPPPFLVRSFLVRSTEKRSRFRIMTVFRSAEDLAAMRSSGTTPRGVQIFNAAGADPTLEVFEIADQFANPGAAIG